MKIKSVLLILFFTSSFLAQAQAQEARTSDFLEYEGLVLWLPTMFDEFLYPSFRDQSLLRANSYETFLEKYPNSLLVPEVKLRLAKLYRDIELPEVHMWRQESRNCASKSSGKFWEVDFCEVKFLLRFQVEPWRDPLYNAKSIKILKEIVEKYGHVKRYAMIEQKIGGFRYVEEEIGREAFFLLKEQEEFLKAH